MAVFESLGLPSPEECAGVVGLIIGLLGITIGIGTLVCFHDGFAAWTVIVGIIHLLGSIFVLCGLGRIILISYMMMTNGWPSEALPGLFPAG